MPSLIQKAVNAIIRPPRKQYNLNTIPLCLNAGEGNFYVRQPLQFVNERKQTIICSLYHSTDIKPLDGGPCVIYLHGNASSQLEGQFLVPNICCHGVFMFLFDFAGCGCSDGDYISLGYFEKQDIEFLMRILHDQLHLGPFILWGRSMGASTALLADSPLIAAKIIDSSFTTLPEECTAIAKYANLPMFFVPAVMTVLRHAVVKNAKFSIDDVSPIKACSNATVPVLFGHAIDDEFIPFEQGKQLFNRYAGKNKFFVTLTGGHNGKRPDDFLKFCITFLLKNIGIDCPNPPINPYCNMWNGNSHFASFQAMFKESRRKLDSTPSSDMLLTSSQEQILQSGDESILSNLEI